MKKPIIDLLEFLIRGEGAGGDGECHGALLVWAPEVSIIASTVWWYLMVKVPGT